MGGMLTTLINGRNWRLRSSSTSDRAIERQSGIDAFRYLLCFSVAMLHSMPSELGYAMPIWMTVFANGCRNAVPFFFIASGYFMRVPASWMLSDVQRPLKRLLPVYLIWFFIYIFVDTLLYGYSGGITIRNVATGGSAYHLWFLPVLCISLVGAPIAISLTSERVTILFAMALALFGVALGAYREVLGLQEFGGVRLTMAPLLVMIGYFIKQGGLKLNIYQAATSVTISFIFLLLEEVAISYLTGSKFTSHPVAGMTYPLGVATFLLAKSLDGRAALQFFAPLGAISLGVYASHLIFIRILAVWIGLESPVQAFAVAVGATLLATVASLALDRLPLARSLVR